MKKKNDRIQISELKVSEDEEIENKSEINPKVETKRTRGSYLMELTEEHVRDLYIDKNYSVSKVSEIMGVPKGTLAKFIGDHNIQKRNSHKESKPQDETEHVCC